ncbi:MAG: DUF1016 family protein [Bacteroidales bacterium]|nr:DUF1016 family protein [Bacteroidales bacterium]
MRHIKNAGEILSTLSREISWSHNTLIMSRCKTVEEREFYIHLEALDRDVKMPHENPSIGVLLCKSKDDEVGEYALSRTLSPTMVAEYELKLPDKALLQHKMQEIAEMMEEE